ncbi:MAG: AAA family ATPase [Terriglobales bacterium]
MRKWMSDRLKRRKKGGEGGSKEKAAAPEPLQPKYFESDLGEKPHAAAVELPRSEPEPETQSDFKLDHRELDSGAESEPAVATPPAETRPTRRRRKRGGRGGARRSPAEAAPVSTAEVTSPDQPLTPEAAAEPPVAAPTPAPEPKPVPAHPVHPLQAAPARPSKGTVVLAIGLPGSGKSSWFKRHNIHPLSSDLLRELLFDDAQEQRFQDLVFSNLRSMLKARLIARRPMNYVDATNLTPHDRHSWIKLAKDYGYDVQGLFFDVPLEVCLERHQRRGRVVPEDIMRKMAGKLKPPTFEEGFSKITVVRVKQKDAAAG